VRARDGPHEEDDRKHRQARGGDRRGAPDRTDFDDILNTQGYKAAAGTVGTVGTFYGIGNQSSISLAFNDAAWANMRRTGLPDIYSQLDLTISSNLGAQLPRRLYYPRAEYATNPHINEAVSRQGADLTSTHVWWDKP